MKRTAFAVVVGSGFAGSLLSWILQKHGRQVIMIDRAKHPRFAIGESSTPTADFLLAYLADRWSLPELAPLAAFGTWQAAYPELRCGLKRGFSYYGHQPEQPFQDDDSHSQSLLVAASATDYWSDTHWYRADVDAFLANQGVQAGVELCEGSSLESAEWNPSSKRWKIIVGQSDMSDRSCVEVESHWLIDASGAGNATASWCGHHPDDEWMRTRSSAIFGHFDDVASFSQIQPEFEAEKTEYFDSDHAAQHHVIADGWYWALRFLGNRTSFGLVQPRPTDLPNPTAVEQHWQQRLRCYPSIERMMSPSRLVDPIGADGSAKLVYVPRMSRCRSHAAGPGWLMLPVAYGFVDPLHSSGIAHALSGVSRVAEYLLGEASQCEHKLRSYSDALRSELSWIDTLVSGCYEGLPSFSHFASFTSVYFAATIAFEKQLSHAPDHWPLGFLNAADVPLREVGEALWQESSQDKQKSAPERFADTVRRKIAPWNTVGLLEPAKKNRLNHTAPPKRAVFCR